MDRLESVHDAGNVTRYSYYADNRLRRVTYPKDRWLEYRYDPAGRVTRLEDHANHVVQYIYDVAGRLIELQDASGTPIITYRYDAAGRLQSERKANGTLTNYEYNASGRIASVRNQQADGVENSRFDYTYDSFGRRDSMTTLDGVWEYEYDATDQLTHANFNSSNASIPNQDLQYVYDAAGNRVKMIQNAMSTDMSVNSMNQLTAAGSTTYQYDLDGNLIRKDSPTETWLYTYDSRDLLTRLSGPGGIWEYEYDAFGNRTAVIENGVRTEFLLDPTGLVNVIGTYDSAGSRIKSFIHGLGLEASSSATDTFFYDFDALGSTAGLTDASQAYVNSYAYSPFGHSLLSNETVDNSFEFVGQSGVMNEDNGLLFMRARYYAPAEGRFATQDPLRLAGGVPNFYTYSGNSPLSRIDPTGLFFNTGGSLIPDNPSFETPDWITGADPTQPHQTPDWIKDLDPSGWGDYRWVGWGGKTTRQKSPFSQRECQLENGRKGVQTGNRGDPDSYGKCHSPIVPRRRSTGRKNAVQAPIVRGYEGDSGDSGAAFAIDPNEKLVSGGFGDAGHVTADALIPYTVKFENLGPGSDPVPDNPATAPAQRVVVTDQLSPNLDWSTLRFTQFGFGDTFVILSNPSPYYFETRAVIVGERNFEVETELSLNSATGLVRAVFQSMEPNTGLPPDVLTGFLPPEDGTGIGQGFFGFTIHPLSDLPSGTAIRNIAEISFDGQTIIATNQVNPQDASEGTDPAKEALITIDAGVPLSHVEPLPSRVPPDFELEWHAQDDPGGSGLARVDIFVSTDGAEPVLFHSANASGSLPVSLEPTGNYEFYSIAYDNVGHSEMLPVNYDSVTIVSPFGDANQDDQVDVNDLNIVATNWQRSDKAWAQGDFTGDGLVDAADLNLLALNWQFGVEAVMAARQTRVGHAERQKHQRLLGVGHGRRAPYSTLANDNIPHASGDTRCQDLSLLTNPLADSSLPRSPRRPGPTRNPNGAPTIFPTGALGVQNR